MDLDTIEPLFPQVEAWIAQDPDVETREELSTLLREAEEGDVVAFSDLADRFDARLQFGTAGLRGELGGGPNRMNRVLVSQAAAGLGCYLLLDGKVPLGSTVVVGYDGRKNSDVFALDTVEILAGMGLHAVLLPRMLPTPVLSFAVRHLDAVAGVMVTASHNPAADNGYKVYLGGADEGSQIVSPADKMISARIEEMAATTTVQDFIRGKYEVASENVVEEYVARSARVGAHTSNVGLPVVVYTALHGVGSEVFTKTLLAAGFPAVYSVPEQQLPDATFPTAKFPNPEEPGALDLAFALGREKHAGLIIANDPDADRLAIAIPDLAREEGFRRLTGNEVGALLGWWSAKKHAHLGEGGTLACSVVSSPALSVVADGYGMNFEWTLTGFKWVSRAPGLVYGFEEALGYLVDPDTCRDKDGISAAMAFLSMVSEAAAVGDTVQNLLDQFSMKFGHYASHQISVRVSDLSKIDAVMKSFRNSHPAEFGGIPVLRVDDLSEGFEGLPPSDVLRFWLEDGSRVMLRPSGTEPKLKVYIDTVCHEGLLDDRKQVAQQKLTLLSAVLEHAVQG